jgi:hypothetical protein
MEERAPRKPNWTLQAILCAGAVAWQTYDLATAVDGAAGAAILGARLRPDRRRRGAGYAGAGRFAERLSGGGTSARGLIRQSFLFMASPDPFPARRPSWPNCPHTCDALKRKQFT